MFQLTSPGTHCAFRKPSPRFYRIRCFVWLLCVVQNIENKANFHLSPIYLCCWSPSMTQFCSSQQFPIFTSASELEAMSFSQTPFWPPVQQQSIRDPQDPRTDIQTADGSLMSSYRWYSSYAVGHQSDCLVILTLPNYDGL